LQIQKLIFKMYWILFGQIHISLKLYCMIRLFASEIPTIHYIPIIRHIHIQNIHISIINILIPHGPQNLILFTNQIHKIFKL
jgi:hypothetical protein